jgi:hypothetical protein
LHYHTLCCSSEAGINGQMLSDSLVQAVWSGEQLLAQGSDWINEGALYERTRIFAFFLKLWYN